MASVRAKAVSPRRGRRARERVELPPDRLIELGRSVLEDEARAVREAAARLNEGFAGAAQLIARAKGRLVVSGMGKAGFVAQKISATFASTGTPSLFLHPADALHGDLGRLMPQDVLLLLSHSGETEEVLRVMSPAKELGVTILAMTATRDSTLGRGAELTLEMGRWEETGTGLAPTTSTTVMLGLGDALAVAVLKIRGFTEDEFRQYHPAGALGRRLMRVSEVMRQGDMLPRVKGSAKLLVALATMTETRGRPGATTVVDGKGKLIGLFTDGDLRRLLEAGAFDPRQAVREVMTPDPKRVHASQYLSEAAAVMRQYAIDQVPVVDERDRPVGLLDVQDLLAMRFV